MVIFQLGLEVYGVFCCRPGLIEIFRSPVEVAIANEGSVLSELVDFERAVGVVPDLAIHLNRNANSGRKINPQDELPMILARAEKLQSRILGIARV